MALTGTGLEWTTILFVLVAILLFPRLGPERKLLVGTICLFILAMVFYAIGAALDPAVHPVSADTLNGAGTFVLGVSYIGIVGILLFGALLPAVGVKLPRIARDVTVGTSHLVWGLIFLQWRGVNLAGIIATSAVLTAVIGLSMQDTLGNLISGLALQIDDSLHVGDWIKVDDVKGQVVETRWRFTAVETNNWETIIIPNSVLMKNKFLVLGRRQGKPMQWRRWIYFNVDYRYPPPMVIEAVEKAVQSAKLPNVATTPLPNCIQWDFADSYARYAVRYWLTDLLPDDPTDSEVRSHIYFALRRAGISPAIPAQAIFMTEETEERRETKATHELEDRLKALRGIDLFRELPEDELRTVASQVSVVPYARGDIITRQASVAHYLYVLVSGTVDIMVENQHEQTARVSQLGPGCYFGEYGAMTGEPRDATVMAASRVEVYRLDKDVFKGLLQSRPPLAEELTQVLAARRTARQAALEHLDAEAQAARLHENHNHILSMIRSLFSLQQPV